VDEEMRPVPPHTVGLLAVQGPTGCRYLADVERQKDYVKNGWNLTGDAFHVDEDGYFWFHSRVDDMIVSAGYNISGAEVEAILLEHPNVKECVVIGVPDADRGQCVKAFVVLYDRSHPTDQLKVELQNHVKSVAAPYKYPRLIECVDE